MDTRQVVSDVEDLIEGVMKTHKRKDWKMLLDGEQLVMRYIAMKILRWADRFKQIADMMMQYDSRHPTLPWGGGFRFLLQICLDRLGTLDAILLGIEKIAGIVDRCAVLEHLHLGDATAASKNLEKSISRLYTAILRFFAKAIQRSKDNPIDAVYTTGKISRR
ncbi:hypothetical protein BZA05DRAFT_211611 [Tricharina praecox]|uniref:uncharacterized protein n=1 Tax=Tricharina praecox TaxID=43433 RepID=UPI002220CE99|nr:uncharacterized protein BZA05DRAFT_211611 [Tricharina praecox]KAI5841656.1 hypothetical protein BZA05DRAFT_211611 [Tricharina praecox]